MKRTKFNCFVTAMRNKHKFYDFVCLLLTNHRIFNFSQILPWKKSIEMRCGLQCRVIVKYALQIACVNDDGQPHKCLQFVQFEILYTYSSLFCYLIWNKTKRLCARILSGISSELNNPEKSTTDLASCHTRSYTGI